MKCLRCGHDSKYKERDGGVCPQCRGVFAFEPQKGDPFTDVGFANAIRAVSGDGTVRFEPAHVYYQLNKQMKPGGGLFGCLTGLATLFGLGSGIYLLVNAELAAGVGALLGVAAFQGVVRLIKRFAPQKPRPTQLTRQSFDTLWQRWQDVHGKPKALINRSRKGIPMRSAELEEELRSYSFDRAVICDTPAVVDVLVANRFHFENNCAILSVDGYPENAFETVRAMLRNNPKLLVLTVHDASVQGCTLAHRLANDPDWFAGRARVVDVGLRPAHDRYFPGMIQAHRTPLSVPVQPGITAAEAAWLASYTLETAAIRPEQLIKRLYKAMVHAESGGLDGGGGDGGGGDGWILFAMDSDTTDGGGDSFG